MTATQKRRARRRRRVGDKRKPFRISWRPKPKK